MSTLAVKVEQYIKLRDHKAAAKKAFDESMSRINQAVQKLEGDILAGLEKDKLKNIKTEFGTAYMKIESTASVKDREKFEDWCRATGNEGAMDVRANKVAVRELLDAGTKVPGVKFSESITVGVRRN